jgi:Protein of unknown function (DUF1769)/Protein of unknown function, DUF547
MMLSPVRSPNYLEPSSIGTTDQQMLRSLELFFRFMVGTLIVILLSARYHSHFIVRVALPKCLEYVCVIWTTIFVLRLILQMPRKAVQVAPNATTSLTPSPTDVLRESLVAVEQEEAVTPLPKKEKIPREERWKEYPLDPSTASPPKKMPRSNTPRPKADDMLYVMDPSSGRRLVPNRLAEPFPLDTDYFQGHMVLILRTPQIMSGVGVPDDDTTRVRQYLQNKQRRFEFQFQVQLKKVPTGRIYFACELREESIKLGLIQRAFVSAAMAFVKTTNPSFHYQLSSSLVLEPNGRYEIPHMAFPVEEGMSRVMVTPPGEAPPVLGSELVESERSIRQRKKNGPLMWQADGTTYTFALWSAYVDFWEWKCLNLPGIRPFLLSNVIGIQPIILSLYELLPSASTGDSTTASNANPPQFHYRCQTVPIVQLEMSHVHLSGLGPVARQWILQQRSNRIGPTPTVLQDFVPQPDADFSEEDGDRGADGDPTADEESIGESGDEEDEDAAVESAVNHRENDPSFFTDERGNVRSISEAFAEELGEGIYVCSGDVVSIREAQFPDDEDDQEPAGASCFVVNGGGFAVLQENSYGTSVSGIVIEKVGKPRFLRNQASRTSSRLIKSGDSVIFKLIGKSGRPEDVRYLTIHRGWWLKWVSHYPQKNGFFTIHTQETEFALRGASTETQSMYLTLGGSFWLRHSRWSKYHVGIASEPSATYGGRMLGLYVPPKFGMESSNIGDVNFFYPSDDYPVLESGKVKKQWMRPLQLQAIDNSLPSPSGFELSKLDTPIDHNMLGRETSKHTFSYENSLIDVPCFVEIMNRTDRIRQQVYVIRIVVAEPTAAAGNDANVDISQHSSDDSGKTFVRLRTGRDLAPIMRLGLKRRSNATSAEGIQLHQQFGEFRTPGQLPVSLKLEEDGSVSVPLDIQTEAPVTPDVLHESLHSSDEAIAFRDNIDSVAGSCDEEWDADSIDELGSVDSYDDVDVPQLHPPFSKRRRSLIGKIARSVKTKTSAAARTTTKTVVNQSVKVGLGTVNAGKATVSAGKAILPMRPKKPPMKEPKSGNRSSRRRRARGLRVDVNSRTIRMLERHPKSSILAGELSAPEQSCRTVSNMLSKISSYPMAPLDDRISDMLHSVVDTPSEFDLSFLRGSAAHVGVSPTKKDSAHGSLLWESLVARSLWESHWREEWCGVYEYGLTFYAPLTETPCLELAYSDIKLVRFLDAGSMSPLAGYPLLVIETAWLCHYCAFLNNQARLRVHEKLEQIRSTAMTNDDSFVASGEERDLVEARFWQGFQTTIQYSQTFGGGKWANIQSGSKSKSRAILNNRRMVFDLNPLGHCADVNQFVEQLLSTALTFSLDSVKQYPELLIQFLDSTSFLRTLSLEGMDKESPETFCLFANIYHCLLQHALLFSVNGPLHKRSFNHFMRTSCYELGGEVFSLSELYSFVLRGKTSRPTSSKPPYINAPKKSSAYRYYSLQYTNPSINFLLSTADCSFPREVPVIDTKNLDSALHFQTMTYIRSNVVVDVAKRHVFLPKIFDVYRNDFASNLTIPGSGYENVRYCLRYLDDRTASQIQSLLVDAALTVKYFPVEEQFYSSLKQASIFHHAPMTGHP